MRQVSLHGGSHSAGSVLLLQPQLQLLLHAAPPHIPWPGGRKGSLCWELQESQSAGTAGHILVSALLLTAVTDIVQLAY